MTVIQNYSFNNWDCAIFADIFMLNLVGVLTSCFEICTIVQNSIKLYKCNYVSVICLKLYIKELYFEVSL